jgi:soluble lytic murein transglycosylase
MAENDLPAAVRMLQELRGKNIPKEISDEALFLLADGRRRQGESRSAFALFQELRAVAPLSPWAAAARKEVEALRKQQPESFALTAPAALAQEGELLLKERQYAEAEKVFRKAQDALAPESALHPRLLLGLANVHRGTRNLEKGMAFLTEIVQNHADSPEAPEALYRVARTLWNRDENDAALKRFEEFRERYPKGSFADFADFASARIQDALGRWSEAERIYREFHRRHPESSLRSMVAWNLAWKHYIGGDYAQAQAGFREIASSPWGEGYRTASAYWQARAAEKGGNREAAVEMYKSLAASPDISYYTRLARTRLAEMGETAAPKPVTTSAVKPSSGWSGDNLFHFSRAQKLAEISLKDLAKSELDAVKVPDGDPHLKLILAREYARNGSYERSVILAGQIPGSGEELSRQRYPLAYWDLIQEKARERGLDPYLVLALVRQESLFNPTAVSSASALGLMQLIPPTANRVAAKIGLQRPESKKLFDPEVNVTLGIAYLKDLLERYSHSLPKAIAAYNAGENAVDRWERQLKAGDEEEFVESIPYGETRLYVKLVLRNHLSYRTLYASP